MKKQISIKTEECWDCGGDGYHVNHHNGNPDRCYTCNGTGKLPYGTYEYKKEYDRIHNLKYEEEKHIAWQRVNKYMKQWEKKNPKPTGKVTIISE